MPKGIPKMKYFEKYKSNTLAGCSNQTFFTTDNKDCEYTGRAFYKVFAHGTYNYSFLFSNMTDSSYRGESYENDPLEMWTILDMGASVVKSPENYTDKNAFANIEIQDMQQVTFGGKEKKIVKPGEFFTSDEVELTSEEGDFICVEITFKGTKIPFHDEARFPIYVYEDGEFRQNNKMPVPGMIGCERDVKKRICFLGDSITQGIGPTFNSYNHWCAKIAENLGTEYSYWNLGIGCAKASDAATDGAWLFKAKQCDFVNLCLGVNDINGGENQERIKKNLSVIVKELKNAGVRVGIFTPFPFDFKEEKYETWKAVCDYVKNDLSKECEYCFDTAEILENKERPGFTVYGGHPNDEGSIILADAFCDYIKKIGFEF